VDRAEELESPYDTLVAALAEWPGLVRRLLDQHPADGRCPICAIPGGRPASPSPCVPRALAERAAAVPAAPARRADASGVDQRPVVEAAVPRARRAPVRLMRR
jgi:hypothetical protein